ncbi:T9SS sorting signal type C domain-containing protein [Flavobacterium sp. ZT3R17]|uniref:T9SS sorting signal type C domain-containing protein n=1 Tax=Flavobacterium cryoconiti TaxID=3398736 RepID=UPI003A87E1CA
MNKFSLLVVSLFLNIVIGYGQCAYTGTPLTSVGTYTFCIDNNSPITTATVNAGQYVLLNVVKGYTYTFSVGNVFTGQENLTVLDASTNASFSPAVTGSGGNTATILNWTSTISGQIKILLSKGSCLNDNSAGGALTLTLVSLGNTQDSQTAQGTDSWTGHIYNYIAGGSPGGASPTTVPINTNPYLSASYAGYYTESENFYQEFSGGGAAANNYCFPVLSNGANLVNIDAQSFAVRYSMKSTKAAGCYIVTLKGDDGNRLYVDGTRVYDNWNDHGIQTSYSMVYLSGSSNLIYDFYENGGLSQVGFDIKSLSTLNTVVQSTINVCSPFTTTLDGSSFTAYGFPAGTITYQWQSSSDNSTWANISLATNEDYTIPIITATAATGSLNRYYRRVITSNVNAGCSNNSNVVSFVISPAAPATPGTITGLTAQCATTTGQVYSVAAVPNAITYNWTVPVGTITSGAGTNSITVTTGSAGSGNITVTATNGCGTSGAAYFFVTVSATTVAGTLTPANTNVCSGSNSTNLTLSGYTGSIVRWESSTDNFATAGTSIANTGSPYTASNLTTDTYYRAVVKNGGCNLLYSNSVKITVYGTVSTPGLISVNGGAGIAASPGTTYCASTAVTFSIAPVANASSYTWVIPTGWTYVSGQGTASLVVTTGTTSQSNNISVYANNLGCGNTGQSYLWVSLSSSSPATPTASVTSQPSCSSAIGTITITAPTGSGITYSIDGVNYTNTTGVFNSVGVGTYSVTAKNASGCISSVKSVTVNPQPSTPSAPIVGAITQPTCAIGTGSVVLSGLPSSGTWTINPGGYTGSGTSTTISGIAAGTYNYTVSNGTCTSSQSTNVPVIGLITKTWDGSTWLNGTPTLSDNIVFNGFYSSATNVDGCSCKVSAGISATILSGGTLKIVNEVTVLGTGVGAGTLTFENDASLVQINDAAVNAGNIKYKRNTTLINKFDFTYWSSPVSPQTLYDLSPNTLWDKFYSFNPVTDYWDQANTGIPMVIGKGYIVRGPQFFPSPNPPTGYHKASFFGVPNNGNYTFPVVYTTAETSNLIGNPYPSALDADAFLFANKTLLDGTIYFWTHNTTIQLASAIVLPAYAGSGIYAYTSDDYASYNGVGGIATASAISGGVIPTGKIAAGQAFFATGIANGNAVFNNSMRVGVGAITGDNSQFFKFSNSKQKIVNTIEKHRVWLNLTNQKGAFKQMLVGYVTNATNEGFDTAFDGESLDGNQFIDFYSVHEDKNLTIQGRSLPFDENDKVVLGYSSSVNEEFSISIGQVDGLFVDKTVYLEDRLLNVIHNLKQSPYNFETENGVFNDRFVLRYTDKTLGTGDFDKENNQVVVSVKNKQIKINSETEMINKILIFDISGKLIYKKINIDNNEMTILNLTSSEQTLLVKIVLKNGQTVTRKIIY